MRAPAHGSVPVRTGRTHRGAFTLAEVAVTIAVVGIAMVLLLEGLSAAKVNAARTRNMKLSKDLALLTLGRIESGLYEDELDDERIEGSYADDGYPDFSFQAVVGDENLPERYDDERGTFFDNWGWEREQAEYDDDDEVEQPYEKIQVRVISPRIGEHSNEYVLERWVSWDQLHPPEDDGDEDRP